MLCCVVIKKNDIIIIILGILWTPVQTLRQIKINRLGILYLQITSCNYVYYSLSNTMQSDNVLLWTQNFQCCTFLYTRSGILLIYIIMFTSGRLFRPNDSFDPRQELGYSRVNARWILLGAQLTERRDANLRVHAHVIVVRYLKWTSRITLCDHTAKK